MTPEDILARDVKRVELVNRYATPFAILLVAVAVFLPSPVTYVRNICIALLAFSIVFNIVTVSLIRRKPQILPKLRKFRMYVNLAVNIVLVYYLSPYWPPIWMLLALAPIATAIYATPKQSMVNSMISAMVLLIIHVVQGGSGLVRWGQTLSRAAFIIFLSLLLNDMAGEAGMNSPKNQ